MLVLGYITCESKQQAQEIAKSLLEQKLIACANILPEIESHYMWKGQPEHSQESLLLIKSESHLQAKIEQSIQALHSYDCPCVVFYESTGGLSSYLDWVSQQVSSS